MVETKSTLGPADIRRLRGTATRAAFARLVGVSGHTIYRWELDDDAPQSRRPRGVNLERLTELARSRAPRADRDGDVATTLTDALEAVGRARHALARANWSLAESEILPLLSTGDQTSATSVLARAAMAELQLARSGDTRSAIATLTPALEAASRHGAEVALWVDAAAAQVFSAPDGRLFDIGKTSHHADRVRRHITEIGADLPADAVREASSRACSAEIGSALYVGDVALVSRMFERAGPLAEAREDPSDGDTITDCVLVELAAHRAVFAGASAIAIELFEQAAERAAAIGFAQQQLRGCSFAAVHRLSRLELPGPILESVQQANETATRAHLLPGFHSIIAASAEGEALVRLGHFESAEEVLANGEQIAARFAWPSTGLAMTTARLLAYQGRGDALAALAERLRSQELVVQSIATNAYAAHVERLAELARGDARSAARALEATAARASKERWWPYLTREILVERTGAWLAAGELDRARTALADGERFLERLPSPWFSALLRRNHGEILSREGRGAEGERLVEAALGTFELGGDVPQIALCRRALAEIARSMRADDSAVLIDESELALDALGMMPPPRPPIEAHVHAGGEEVDGRASAIPATAIVTPIQRLCIRGVGPELVSLELGSILRRLLPDLGHRVEPASGSDTASSAAIRIGGWSGAPMQVTVDPAATNDQRALIQALCDVASLSMEAAQLRGSGGVARPPTPRARRAAGQPAGQRSIIASSASMIELREDIGRLAGSSSTILITGESGVGKEVVADMIHRRSNRRARPFIAVNCTAIPRELFEGQLFGYNKGAFTGATENHLGLIRAADGGTLFLDEVAELPLDLQPKLLRFLENREIHPLGESRPVGVDVRVLAATHQDLETLIGQGRFRQDLYFRLHVVPMRIPPLRERREDIVALAVHFIATLSPEGAPTITLAGDAKAALLAHAWPGNVRELRNVIERALAFAPVPRLLRAAHLRFEKARRIRAAR